MQLPDISIPLTLPFEVPLMLHPVVVHFAVVLPIIVLILELANLGFKRRAVSVTSLGLLLLAAVVYVAAYYTGKADGSEAFALLGDEAKEELKAHRLLGTYLAYTLLLPIVFKLVAMTTAQKWARGLLIVSLVMFISFVFKQGYDGGELVYEYGVNVKAVGEKQEAVEDAMDEISDMNETIVSQEEEIEVLKAELETLKTEAEEGFGKTVNTMVDDAVSQVKKIFNGDENATQASTAEGNATGETNATADAPDEGIIAVDDNATKESI